MKYSLRSFKFSIRDLLWLTAVVALMVGWAVERMDKYNLIKQLRRLQIRLALEEDNNKHLKDRVMALEETNAMVEAIKKDIAVRALGTPMPISSAPAPNPPKP